MEIVSKMIARSAHHKTSNKLSTSDETDQKNRMCLRCQKHFPSAHVGNRMCPRCIKAGDGQLKDRVKL